MFYHGPILYLLKMLPLNSDLDSLINIEKLQFCSANQFEFFFHQNLCNPLS